MSTRKLNLVLVALMIATMLAGRLWRRRPGARPDRPDRRPRCG